ncbi:MAG TPA: hypothetical protein VHS59_09025 [Bacillota bacterium]|nr:hypothetical protein [Bacillota bacterium]
MFEHQHGPYKFSVEETEEGYAIHVKGDKEKLKAKLEALEAYQTYREKAKAAGLSHHHGHGHHGLFSMLHKHMQAFHQHHHHKHRGE